MTAYAVIGHPQTRAFRVMWMLEELGLAYEIDPAPPRSDRAREGDPIAAKVPALFVDGAPYTDSVAIIQYLADAHAACTFPAGTLDRLRQDGCTHFVLDEMEGPLWTTAKSRFVLPEERRKPEIAETCAWEFDTALDRLARRVGDGPWLMGETFTVPDLLAGHCLDWGGKAFGKKAEGPVADYHARLRARPAYARAVERTKAVLAAA